MKRSLLFTALLAATPLALLLPGCSGGNSGVNSFFPTPKPAATATPAPVSTTQTSNFTFGNGQRAILQTVIGADNKLTGTIQILAPLAQSRIASALTTSIKIGTFSISGTFSPPRGYSYTVLDGGATLFSMSGLLPTATENGTYSFTGPNGQTDSGIVPRIGGPTSTSTPVSTGTTPPTNIPAGINLTFTPSNPANFVELPLDLTQFIVEENSTKNLIFTFTKNQFSPTTSFFVQGTLISPEVGKTYTLPVIPGRVMVSGLYVESSQDVSGERESKGAKFDLPVSGSITVVSLSAGSAALRFNNVLLRATRSADNAETVRVNGTVSGNFTAQ